MLLEKRKRKDGGHLSREGRMELPKLKISLELKVFLQLKIKIFIFFQCPSYFFFTIQSE